MLLGHTWIHTTQQNPHWPQQRRENKSLRVFFFFFQQLSESLSVTATEPTIGSFWVSLYRDTKGQLKCACMSWLQNSTPFTCKCRVTATAELQKLTEHGKVPDHFKSDGRRFSSDWTLGFFQKQENGEEVWRWAGPLYGSGMFVSREQHCHITVRSGLHTTADDSLPPYLQFSKNTLDLTLTWQKRCPLSFSMSAFLFI